MYVSESLKQLIPSILAKLTHQDSHLFVKYMMMIATVPPKLSLQSDSPVTEACSRQLNPILLHQG